MMKSECVSCLPFRTRIYETRCTGTSGAGDLIFQLGDFVGHGVMITQQLLVLLLERSYVVERHHIPCRLCKLTLQQALYLCCQIDVFPLELEAF